MSAAARFQYVAVDRSGQRTRGVVNAATRADAYRSLAGSGLTPVRLRAASGDGGNAGGGVLAALKRDGVSKSEIAHFTYQLSVLLGARIPVVQCFRSIAEQEPNDKLRAIVLSIAQNVEAGNTITESIEPHARLFGTVYVETVRAAESSGNLVAVLEHLAEQVEEQQEMRRVVRGALMYPVAVLATLAIATLFLLTFVLPRFAEMFAERGVDLPWLTVALLAVGDALRHYWYAFLAGIGGVIALARIALRSPLWRERIDAALHRVPYLRAILVGLAVSRFAGVFGVCLRSGLGLIESLEMAGRATGRPMLQRDARVMVDQVRAGGRLRLVLDRCEYLPGFVKQLLAAGEETSEIPKMCGIAARHYSRETKHLTKNASTVLEPVLIAMLTGVVLVVALAVFLPMWDMASLM